MYKRKPRCVISPKLSLAKTLRPHEGWDGYPVHSLWLERHRNSNPNLQEPLRHQILARRHPALKSQRPPGPRRSDFRVFMLVVLIDTLIVRFQLNTTAIHLAECGSNEFLLFPHIKFGFRMAMSMRWFRCNVQSDAATLGHVPDLFGYAALEPHSFYCIASPQIIKIIFAARDKWDFRH